MSEDMVTTELKQDVGKIVLVKLKGAKMLRGKLWEFDPHMNISLQDAVEISEDDTTNPLGAILVRGDNIIMISPPT
jgi:small nuclear ribonucleoprotein